MTTTLKLIFILLIFAYMANGAFWVAHGKQKNRGEH